MDKKGLFTRFLAVFLLSIIASAVTQAYARDIQSHVLGKPGRPNEEETRLGNSPPER